MVKDKKEKLIYIPLQEASKYCNYSQEYLSLRARQGKLKSAKFGRNWVTTEEWLEEYIKKSEEYNSIHNGNSCGKKSVGEIKAPFLITAFPVVRIEDVKKIKIIKVPKNLPREKEPILQFRFTVALVLVLFLMGGFFAQRFFLDNAFKNISSLEQKTSLVLGRTKTNINSEILTADLQGKFQEYVKVLFSGIKIQFAIFKTRILSLGDLFNKKSAEENKKEGIVVISSSEENEAIKEKIQKSFSDEVKVEIKDESSGIITPVFQKGDGEKYFYIMVPIKN